MEKNAVLLIWALIILGLLTLLTEPAYPWCVLSVSRDNKECPRGYVAVDAISSKGKLSYKRAIYCFLEYRELEILESFKVNIADEIAGKCYQGIDNPPLSIQAIDADMNEEFENN